MRNNKPLFYWDSCIWLAWLKNEKRQPGEIDGILDVVDKVDRNQVTLIVSQQVDLEILEAKWPNDAAKIWDEIFKRRNVKKVPVTWSIISLGQQIRNFYQGKIERGEAIGKTVSSMDAVHLATAITYEVDQFHTFDDGKQGKSMSLISLSGNVAGHSLLI